MDSKTLLAIVLSFLLFLAWNFYFGPKQPHPSQQQQTTTTTTTQPQTPALPAAPSPALPPKVNISEQKTWSIGDSLYKMKIIAQGARETSFELLKFKEELKPNSPPIQLIRDPMYAPLAIDLVSHKDWELYKQPFSGDAPTEFKVSRGEPPRNITFQTEVPGKVLVTKIFTVEFDSYALNLEIQIQNLSAEKLSDSMDAYFYFSPYPESEHEKYNPSRLTFSTNRSNHDLQPKDLEKHTAPPPLRMIG